MLLYFNFGQHFRLECFFLSSITVILFINKFQLTEGSEFKLSRYLCTNVIIFKKIIGLYLFLIDNRDARSGFTLGLLEDLILS